MFTKNKIVIAIVIVLLIFSARLFAKESKTIITGDQMEIIHSGQTVIFSGNSKVKRGNSVLKADKIVQDKKSNRVEAFGNVDFETTTTEKELLLGKAQKAKYIPSDGKGELFEGRPIIIYHIKNSTYPITLEADRIEFDENKQEIFANGQVLVLSSSVCAYSPNVLFRQREKEIFMTGTAPQPEVIYIEEGNKGRYNADKITMFVEKKIAYLSGNVHGKIVLNNKK